MKWAKQEARLETLKYKKEQQSKAVQITFHSDHKLDFDQQVFWRGGYLFPQTFYYRLQLDKTCRKIRDKYKFKFDLNAILSDLIYARILSLQANVLLIRSLLSFLNVQLTSYMMCTVLLMCLEMNAISFNPKFIKQSSLRKTK